MLSPHLLVHIRASDPLVPSPITRTLQASQESNLEPESDALSFAPLALEAACKNWKPRSTNTKVLMKRSSGQTRTVMELPACVCFRLKSQDVTTQTSHTPLGASPGLRQLQKPEGRPDGRAGRRGEPEDREGSAKSSSARKYPALFCFQSVSELVVWEKMLPDQ